MSEKQWDVLIGKCAIALVAYVNAGVLHHPGGPALYAAYQAPIAYAASTVCQNTIGYKHNPHRQYTYSYDVHEASTGDSKTQSGTRDGGVVVVNGINAVVRKEPALIAAASVIKYHQEPQLVAPEQFML
ncbi:hypothetical protein QAD02_014312 [Eretmocerus hayati]|uniref:Uncharacterized protein n=1 Tax=Eretmocerus hayati TaxID=131215 RepID=A0ACC2P9S5_9HYME|nr:hypothetical protein QAD02_014312 [Eretmocerus hayati]